MYPIKRLDTITAEDLNRVAAERIPAAIDGLGSMKLWSPHAQPPIANAYEDTVPRLEYEALRNAYEDIERRYVESRHHNAELLQEIVVMRAERDPDEVVRLRRIIAERPVCSRTNGRNGPNIVCDNEDP